MGRRSVWSDTRLIDAAQPFVPVADEVYRLQTGRDAECLTFQSMADRGHYRRAGGTRQGIYACTPAGELLGSLNSNDPDRVLAMIASAWEAWEALPEERRRGSGTSAAPGRRWEDAYPADGLVLESTGRDVQDGVRDVRWNRDHVWFSRDEARRMLPADPAVGERHEVPVELVRRLARFHFVDDVRGQSVPFAPQEVEVAEMVVEVLAREGDRVRLAVRGRTHADAPGPWQMGDNIFRPADGAEHAHGMTTELLGEAAFDLGAGRFTAFDAVVRAERWGRTINNARWNDTERSTLGFVFRIAPPGNAQRVPPAFVQVYDAPWLEGPSEPEASTGEDA